MKESVRILFCNCAHSGVIDAGRKREVFDGLADRGVEFEAVADLCGLAARKDPALAALAGADGVTVVACYPRAVRALFDAAGAPLPADAQILNMREAGAEEILSALPAGDAAREKTQPPQPDDEWIPWFPVIDADRCTNCKQCMGFCLFGVYGLSGDDRVVVESPANCKTNCPACARICPAVAIIFPKHEAAPINGADDGEPAEPVSVNIAEILKGDVYEVLRRRQAEAAADCKACACSRDQSPAEALGVPPEVLAASPQLKAFLDRARPTGETDETCCDDTP